MKSKVGKLGVCRTWAVIFKLNEDHFRLGHSSKVLTDEQITKIMLSEFPAHQESQIFKQPNRARNRYNRGALVGGKIPRTKSYKYLRQGSKVIRVERRKKRK